MVAAKGDQTEMGEEATVCWWPDLSDVVRRSRHRQRKTLDDRGTKGGRTKPPQRLRRLPMKTRNGRGDPPRDRFHHPPGEGERADRRIVLLRSKPDAPVNTTGSPSRNLFKNTSRRWPCVTSFRRCWRLCLRLGCGEHSKLQTQGTGMRSSTPTVSRSGCTDMTKEPRRASWRSDGVDWNTLRIPLDLGIR